jgi:hypothetical protein
MIRALLLLGSLAIVIIDAITMTRLSNDSIGGVGGLSILMILSSVFMFSSLLTQSLGGCLNPSSCQTLWTLLVIAAVVHFGVVLSSDAWVEKDARVFRSPSDLTRLGEARIANIILSFLLIVGAIKMRFDYKAASRGLGI